MKKERRLLTPKFTNYQYNKIESLVDVLGGSPSEVVSRIVMMWLLEKNEYVEQISKGE